MNRGNFSIKKAAVIGAGTMGAGIAAHIVGSGIPVCLFDIVPKELTDDDKAKGYTTESKEFRNKFSQAGKDNLNNLKTGVVYEKEMIGLIEVGNLEDDLDKLKNCDWIIEVIIEDLEMKKGLLNKIYPYCNENAIVTSNTSGISITDIVEDFDLEFRKRFLGTHFFNPPRYMHLFEIVPGKDTCEDNVRFMKDFATRILGKGVVIAKDTPNFIANRIGVYSSALAFKLMEKYNLNIEEVDQITGPVMGRPRTATYKTMDLVGLDIMVDVSNNLVETLSDKDEAENFILPDFIMDNFLNKRLGDKTKGGFYKKIQTSEGRTSLVWNVEKKEYVSVSKKSSEFMDNVKKQKGLKDQLKLLISSEEKESKFAWNLIKNTLLYSASKVPEIADDYKEIDKAMKWGYNWEIGPFEIWDTIGVEESIERMKSEDCIIPKWIEDRIEEGNINFYENDPLIRTFDALYPVIKDYDFTTLLDMGDGVACLEVKTKGSAISGLFMKVLQDTIIEIEKNNDYKGLIIASSAKNLLNGADLADFYKKGEEKDYDGILATVDEFHKTSMMLKYSKKPIIAAVRGMAIGGGLEFVMHCSKVVAHTESYMGLVEVGVGIVPGGGGIKELLFRYMEKIEGMKFPDLNPVIQRIWETIAMGVVSKNAFDAKKLGFLRETDRIVMNKDLLLEESKKELIKMVEDGFRKAIKKPVKVTGVNGKAYLDSIIITMEEGKFISEYDAVIGKELANAVAGGNVPKGTLLTEDQLLKLEKQAIGNLIKNDKTIARVKNMLINGRVLRN